MIRRYMDGITSTNQVLLIIHYGANGAMDFNLLKTVKAKKDGVDPTASDYISTEDFTLVDYYSYDKDLPFIPSFSVIPKAGSTLYVRMEYNNAHGFCLYKLDFNGNQYIFGLANVTMSYIQEALASLGYEYVVYSNVSEASSIRPTIIV